MALCPAPESLPPGTQNGEHEFTPKFAPGKFLARRYGVSRRTILLWTSQGILPFMAINQRCFLYDVRACDKALGKFQV